jgi:hypothetical protein
MAVPACASREPAGAAAATGACTVIRLHITKLTTTAKWIRGKGTFRRILPEDIGHLQCGVKTAKTR